MSYEFFAYICSKLLIMELSDDDLRYLSNKHRGGINNKNGNIYEDFYTVCLIFRLMASNHSADTLVCRQKENAFVDDLYVVMNDKDMYCQLKNKKEIYWGKNEKGNICYDFVKQEELCDKLGKQYILRLVSTERPKDEKPAFLTHSEMEFFPFYENINIYAYDEIGKDVALACNFRENEYARISDVMTLMLGLCCSNVDKTLTLGQLADDITKISHGYYSCKSIYRNIDKELLDKLSNMGFDVSIEGETIFWKYGKMAGNTLVDSKKSQVLLSCVDVEEVLRKL